MTSEAVRDFREEPAGIAFEGLLNAALPYCATCSLVARDGYGSGESIERALRVLSPWLVSEERRSAWPGTELLFGKTARVFTYRYEAGIVPALVALGPSLYRWQHPELPEDLALLRADGTVWLGSVAHERDAFVALRPEEERALRSEVEISHLIAASRSDNG